MSDTSKFDAKVLADLLAKLATATEPNRWLDAEIDAALFGGRASHDFATEPGGGARLRASYDPGTVFLNPDPNDNGGHVLTSHHRRSAAVTASIDASLALVDRLCGVDDTSLCYSYDLGWHASAHAGMAFTADLHLAVGDPAEMQSAHGQGATLPLAILAALLSALSQGEQT